MTVGRSLRQEVVRVKFIWVGVDDWVPVKTEGGDAYGATSGESVSTAS